MRGSGGGILFVADIVSSYRHVYLQVNTMSGSIVLPCVNSTTGDMAYNPVAVLEPVVEACHPEDPKAIDKSIALLKDVASPAIAVF
jgi:hypothetical protein